MPQTWWWSPDLIWNYPKKIGERWVFVLKREVHLGTENLHDPWSYHHQQSPHPCHPTNPLPPKKEAGPTVPSTCLSPICCMTSMHFCHFKACPTASTNAPKPRKDNGVANGDNGIRTAALLHLSLVVAKWWKKWRGLSSHDLAGKSSSSSTSLGKMM